MAYTPDIAVTDTLFQNAYAERKALDCQKSYRMVGKVKVNTSASDLQQTTFLLGRPPRPFEDYARDTVTAWQTAGLVAEPVETHCPGGAAHAVPAG